VGVAGRVDAERLNLVGVLVVQQQVAEQLVDGANNFSSVLFTRTGLAP
jgi:hypothetical protein